MKNAFKIISLTTSGLNVRVEKTAGHPRVFMYYKLQHQITMDIIMYWKEKPLVMNGQEWDEENKTFTDIKEGIY